MTISTHCHAAVRALLAVALAGVLVVLPAGPVDAGSTGPRQGAAHGGQGGGPPAPGHKPGDASPHEARPSRASRHPSTATSPAPKRSSAPSPAASRSSSSPAPAPGNNQPASVSKASVGAGAPAPGHRKPSHAGRAGRGPGHERGEDAETDDTRARRAPTPTPAPPPAPARSGPVAPAASSVHRFSGASEPRPAPVVPESAAPAIPETAAPVLGPSLIERARDLVPEPGEAVPALRDPTIPMLLVVALVAYALIVGRGDRRDPKLARSSVDPGPKGVGFR